MNKVKMFHESFHICEDEQEAMDRVQKRVNEWLATLSPLDHVVAITSAMNEYGVSICVHWCLNV